MMTETIIPSKYLQKKQSSQRIRSLDGLRALSIIMVILGHIRKYLPSEISSSVVYQYVSNSTLGVSIFFVISGYLITKLLIAEREKKEKVNLKHFYIRRILRIFPIFYLYILVILVISLVLPEMISNYNELGIAALYLWNYKQLFHITGNASLYVGHYWSLSMEEQFYLLWPFAFVTLSKRSLLRLVIIVLCCMPFIRVATYYLMPSSRGQIHMMIQTGGDTILIGCLIALIESLYPDLFIKWSKNKWLGIGSAIFIFILSRTLNSTLGGSYQMSVGQSIENVFVAGFVLWSVYGNGHFQRFLNTKILIQIGIISYSIYVWHVLILRNPGSWLPETLWVKVPLMFIVAMISYYLIEKPIIKLKARFI